jgi:hypothetical protein
METDKAMAAFSTSALQIVPFPVPDGPETTNNNPFPIKFPFTLNNLVFKDTVKRLKLQDYYSIF